jgi:hypothetical protein
VAKRKKKTRQSKRPFSRLGRKDLRVKKAKEARRGLGILLKIMAMMAVLAGIMIGFMYMDQYLDNKFKDQQAQLQLVDAPDWVNGALKEKIYAAAGAGGEDFVIDANVAETVQQNIEQRVPWISEVNVQATNDSLLIGGNWRRPVAMFEAGRYYYIDSNMVVLDYVPIESLSIVKIIGLLSERVPQPGNVWNKADLAAAVEILKRLEIMDESVPTDKPLLNEIASIDVSNYGGRKSRSQPHIELYAKDGTKIIWGAEVGKWSEYLEATDMEKLSRLYNYYTQNGTLMGTAKYINLREPQDYVPQPGDEY